ncbi:MAG: HEAT repeat domain-containing protein [Anaerolineae bacterium]|nr:HEAT repeat domain-containing protein [Anaerolineae bacterium]
MAKNRRLETQLAALNALRSAPFSENIMTELRKGLADRSNHITTRAAEIVGEMLIEALEPDLEKAFARFMVNSLKTDPGCHAKIAIAEALYRIESHLADVFLQGIMFVQMEPTYGGKVDTAAKLRGVCALGLVRMQHPDALILLAQLLADPVTDARIAAARALGYAGQLAGIPLLRYKALIGDTSPQMMCECLGALLKIAPESSLAFVAGFLQDENVERKEAAALALGESHLSQALPFLETAWEDTFDADLRRALLLAIAMLRTEEAIAFLLDIIREGARVHAESALEALRMYQRDDLIWPRVETAWAVRKEI